MSHEEWEAIECGGCAPPVLVKKGVYIMTHKHEFPHSTSIQCCEYDPATKDMHITFVSGGKHKFSGVEQEDFDGFKTAKSVGTHFHTNIRRKYQSERVED